MSTPLPSHVRIRLAKMIRVLGSDKEGDVVNSVLAIGRVLESEGKTFHDLAAIVEGTSSLDILTARRAARRPATSAPNAPYYRSRPIWDDLRGFQVRDWLTVFLTKLQLSPEQAALMSEYRVKANAEELMNWQPSEKQLRVAKQLLKLAWKTGARP